VAARLSVPHSQHQQISRSRDVIIAPRNKIPSPGPSRLKIRQEELKHLQHRMIPALEGQMDRRLAPVVADPDAGLAAALQEAVHEVRVVRHGGLVQRREAVDVLLVDEVRPHPCRLPLALCEPLLVETVLEDICFWDKEEKSKSQWFNTLKHVIYQDSW
jgi:hypothetical protein